MMLRSIHTGAVLPAPLLAGHASAHAPGAGLLHGGEHRGGVRLHPVQGHLRGAHAHCSAGSSGQVGGATAV